jgi:hypothetical protein
LVTLRKDTFDNSYSVFKILGMTYWNLNYPWEVGVSSLIIKKLEGEKFCISKEFLGFVFTPLVRVHIVQIGSSFAVLLFT